MFTKDGEYVPAPDPPEGVVPFLPWPVVVLLALAAVVWLVVYLIERHRRDHGS